MKLSSTVPKIFFFVYVVVHTGCLVKGSKRICYWPSSNFVELATKSDCFVDKSLLIKEIFENETALLITAAPGFGKTVNLDMLKRFIEIPTKETPSNGCEIFRKKNLTIYREHEQLFDRHCERYPVIHVDFQTAGNVTDIKEARSKFRQVIGQSFREHSYLLDSERLDKGDKDKYTLYSGRGRLNESLLIVGLTELAKLVSKHYDGLTDRKPFVLIDNYDASFSNLTFIDRRNIERIVEALKVDDGNASLSARDSADLAAFSGVKQALNLLTYIIQDVVQYNEGHVSRALISGRIQLFGFGYLHVKNLTRYPFLNDHRFTTYYGLTAGEVKSVADKFGMDCVHLHLIDDWYGGYRLTNRTAVQIYRPTSVLRYVQDPQHVGRSYWTNSEIGGVQNWQRMFLHETFRRILFNLLDGRHWELLEMNAYNADELTNLAFVVHNEDPNDPTLKTRYFAHKFLQLLTDYGYFNILNRSQTNMIDNLNVSIPNREVYTSLYHTVYGDLFYSMYFQFDTTKAKSFGEALYRLESNHSRDNNNRHNSFAKLKQSVENLFAEPIKLPPNELAFKSSLYYAAKNQSPANYFQTLEMEIGEKYDGQRRLIDLIAITDDGKYVILNANYNRTSAEIELERIIDRNSYQMPDRLDKNLKRITGGRIYVGLHLNADRRVNLCYLISSLTLEEKICL